MKIGARFGLWTALFTLVFETWACGTSGSGGDKSGTIGEKYLAMCPDGGDETAQLAAMCTVPGKGDRRAGMCAFIACAVEVGKCDNEEKGDYSIEKCQYDKDWMSKRRRARFEKRHGGK
jgi:hypothetical protein